MKNPTLGLALSAVAFGASTVYLWGQLDAAQEQAAALSRANAGLTSRIAELQRRRAEMDDQRRAVGDGVLRDSRVDAPGPKPPEGLPAAGDDRQVWTHVGRDGASPPPMPDSMLKMMRANMRAHHKRMYFDLQSKLGLTDDQTSDLLDLITDQHSMPFKGPRNLAPEQAREYWEAEEAKRQAAIDDLLGPGKAAEFAEYQKSMPARSELLMISQQLEGVDTPLTDSQRSRLLDAMIAERDRIPMPGYLDAMSPEESAKAYGDWQADYEKRVNEAARSILTSEQLNTVSNYQQWQRDMRQQVAAQGPGGPPVRMRGDATFFAAPAVGFSVAVENASSPTEKPSGSK